MRFGVASVLGIVFVVLKLCKVISWSWWIVTCPFWIPLLILLFLFAGIGLIIAEAFQTTGKTMADATIDRRFRRGA